MVLNHRFLYVLKISKYYFIAYLDYIFFFFHNQYIEALSTYSDKNNTSLSISSVAAAALLALSIVKKMEIGVTIILSSRFIVDGYSS